MKCCKQRCSTSIPALAGFRQKRAKLCDVHYEAKCKLVAKGKSARMKALCAKLDSGKGSTQRQSRKANKMWCDTSSVVRRGRWPEPECIYVVLQSKWDNESIHIKQTRGAHLASDTEDGPLAATVQNCLRNFRLKLANAPPLHTGSLLGPGLRSPIPQKDAAAAKLVGHTWKEWTAA